MIGAIGLSATITAAGAALFGAWAALRAARGHTKADTAVRAAWVALGALVVANAAMVVALASRDFSIAYVAQVGSRATPLLFTVASLWGALEGSILLWAMLLAGVAALLVARTRGEDDGSRLPGALAVLLSLVGFFTLLVLGPSDPWRRMSPVPLDGPGPNPLLQDNVLMAFHPPLLYLGFVGLAVPFALTIDALARGRIDDGWLRLARRWTLWPWVLLTLGLVTGAWWSYAVLGWGGYWGWDPVENVALLPWLTATAFLHSAMVARRGGGLQTWNVALVTASFALTLLATLVTRSGVLASVHAFTRTPIGPLFAGLLGATLVGTAGLIALRLPVDARGGKLGARGRAILIDNMLLATIAATVLFGTVFPLAAEAFAGVRVSVGAPYFERIVGPLAVGLLVLVGIGPSLPWGEWSARSRRSLIPAGIAAVLAAGAVAALGSEPPAVAGVAAGVFAVAGSIGEVVRRASRGARGLFARAAVRHVLDGRVAGGLISHLGVGLVALAVIASASGSREATVDLRPGEAATVVGRRLSFLGTETLRDAGRVALAARVEVGDGASALGLTPSLVSFATTTQPIATPAIVPGVLDDLYVTLLNVDPTTGVATLRVATRPFVSWVWPAGMLIALGGAMAAWPRVRGASARGAVPARSAVGAGSGAALDAIRD